MTKLTSRHVRRLSGPETFVGRRRACNFGDHFCHRGALQMQDLACCARPFATFQASSSEAARYDTAGASQLLVQNANLADAERERFGNSGARHVSLKAAAYHAHTLQFPLTQRERPFAQQVTFSHCR